jgi:hypothetical protein
MADQETPTVEQPSYLGMSDEEIMNSSGPAEIVQPQAQAEEKDPADDAGDPPADDADTKADDAEDDNDDEATGTVDEKEVSADAESGEKAEDKGDEKSEEAKPDDSKKEPEKVEDAQAVDFEAEYKRLLAPFKANGREISVGSVDDAIVLMQMGANYNKKMAALKPNLKLMKLLENNGLLSEEKIGFLIDLEKKNPAAINKLVKDSGIDPMDLDAEKASGYKQTAYTVDDREIELDTVLDELQGTPSYNRTLEIVSTKWDGASKQVIAGNPQLLKVINDHVSAGIYDVISQEIERERVFGRLSGLSDIEAYRQVGDALHAKGAFTSLAKGSSPNQEKPATPPVVVTPKPKVEDDTLKDKRRAASSTRPAAPTSAPKDFNPLALSDEEFTKLVNKQFL